MSAESLIMQSVVITIIGMLIVFVFLIIMVGVMHLLAWLVKVLEKYFPQTVAQPAAAAADNSLVAIAIAAAKRFQGK